MPRSLSLINYLTSAAKYLTSTKRDFMTRTDLTIKQAAYIIFKYSLGQISLKEV